MAAPRNRPPSIRTSPVLPVWFVSAAAPTPIGLLWPAGVPRPTSQRRRACLGRCAFSGGRQRSLHAFPGQVPPYGHHHIWSGHGPVHLLKRARWVPPRRLSVNGTLTQMTGILDLSGSGTSFTLTPATGSAITSGAFHGRLAGGQSAGVSGVFVTTNTTGTRYAGGFVGAGPQVAVPTQRFGTGGVHGFGTASVTIDNEADETDLVFVATNVNLLIRDVNHANSAFRGRSVLENIRTNNGTPSSRGTTRGVAFETGRLYGSGGSTVDIDTYEAGPFDASEARDARLFRTTENNNQRARHRSSVRLRGSAADRRRAGQWRLYLGGCSSCRRGGRRVPHHGDAHRRRHRQFHLCHTRQDRQRPAHRRHWRLRHDNGLALEFDRQQCHQADTL